MMMATTNTNNWYIAIKVVATLKSILGVIGATPVATYLVLGYYDEATIGWDMLFWASFWMLYVWNASLLFRVIRWSRPFSITLDMVCAYFFWRAFIGVGLALSDLPPKVLLGLFPFAFILFLLLPPVKAHFTAQKPTTARPHSL